MPKRKSTAKATSTTTFTPTQTTAAPAEGYREEDAPQWFENHWDRIWRVETIEGAVSEFADILPYWITCDNCPQAQKVFKAILAQWENLRRKKEYSHVPPLPSDMRSALIWLNNVQQYAQKEGRLPDEWPEPQGDKIDGPTKHGPDYYCFGPGYRSVYWRGQPHSFTYTQAAIVEILAEAYEAGTPDVDAALLVGDGAFTQERLKKRAMQSDAHRVRDLFRGNSAWGTMIISGVSRGTYRLCDHKVPDNS